MTTKNFGAGVSAYRDVDGRSFETTVHQASKPVLDSELNQIQDISQAQSRSIVQLAQSGWLTGAGTSSGEDGCDILDTSSHSSGIFVDGISNNYVILPRLTALVNGWLITVASTGSNNDGSTDWNGLSLDAGPAGAGSLRTDLIILEVWRRLLSASPSTEGKSQTGRIWRNGNVKIESSADLDFNYADDILDANVGSETTKRVQIQYRLRVISGVDLDAFPSGIGDPTVVAFSVPASAVLADGNATAFPYALPTGNGDRGLWRAGDSNPANDIGSVDGFMYALPLLAVFRRNTAPFARDTNHNGGSGRPDGFAADAVEKRDIIDLRTSVSTTGWDLQEFLQKNVNLILDNTLRTEQETTPLGGGSKGHTNIWADEIGPTDNPGAQAIRHGFDGVCRRFSDRPILETVTVAYTTGDLSGSTLIVDPLTFSVYPYGAANYTTAAPDNIVILDVISIVATDATSQTEVMGPYIDDGGTGAYNFLGSSYSGISGLGSAGPVTIEFASPPAPTNIYVTLLISYPGGAEPSAGGLTKTPTVDYGAGSFVFDAPGIPVAAPYDFQSLETSFDYPHREVAVTYTTLPTQTFTEVLGAGSMTNLPFASNFVIYVPERVDPASPPVIVNNTSGDSYVGPVTVSNDGRFVFVTGEAADWTPSGVVNFGDEVETTYQAIRPVPDNALAAQLTIYYEARAPQTIRDALLGTSLTVIPRYIAPYLYTLVTGSGSLDESYPFPSQYVQSPGVYPGSGGTFTGDHELDGSGAVSISDFNAQTGFLQIPTLIPAVPEPQLLTFDRVPGDIDAEQRSFFKSVPVGYIPSAFAQPLSNDKRHKNVLPMIVELAADSPTLGPKGTLLVVLLSRWAEFDAHNFVAFDGDLASNFTSASVYRLKGNPLNHRRA